MFETSFKFSCATGYNPIVDVVLRHVCIMCYNGIRSAREAYSLFQQSSPSYRLKSHLSQVVLCTFTLMQPDPTVPPLNIHKPPQTI